MSKPKVILVGADGNAFSILGRCQRAAKRAGWSKEEISSFFSEATSGSYEQLLRTVMDRFDVGSEEEED